MRRLTPSGSRLDVDAADRRRAARRLQQPAEHADRRRLAGAVAAEKPEDLALADLERQPIDGDEVAEAPREIGDGDGVHRPSARAILRVREVRVGHRLRAIELGLQERDLRIEHIGAGRDAGGEALAEHAARFRRAAHGVGGGVDGRPARVDLTPALADFHRERRVEVGEPRLGRASERGGFRDLAARAAAVEERPGHVDARVPRGPPRFFPREDARVRVGVVDAAADANRRLACRAAAARPRSPAALTRLTSAARSGRCSRAVSTSASSEAAGAGGASSAAVGRDAACPAPRPTGGRARLRRCPASPRACTASIRCRDSCASTVKHVVRRDQPGGELIAHVPEVGADARHRFLHDAQRLGRGDQRPVGARDLERQIAARRGDLVGRRGRLDARGALERVERGRRCRSATAGRAACGSCRGRRDR